MRTSWTCLTVSPIAPAPNRVLVVMSISPNNALVTFDFSKSAHLKRLAYDSSGLLKQRHRVSSAEAGARLRRPIFPLSPPHRHSDASHQIVSETKSENSIVHLPQGHANPIVIFLSLILGLVTKQWAVALFDKQPISRKGGLLARRYLISLLTLSMFTLLATLPTRADDFPPGLYRNNSQPVPWGGGCQPKWTMGR
jgi:hypothetical protein